MRTLSTRAIAQANALNGTDVWLVLLTVDHPTFPAPYRFVRNNEDVVSRGETFTAYAFDMTLAVDDGETMPQVSITIDNVTGDMIEVFRGAQGTPYVSIEIVLHTQPDIIEMSLYDMKFDSVTIDQFQVSGNLVAVNLMDTAFPSDTYLPTEFPSLFY